MVIQAGTLIKLSKSVGRCPLSTFLNIPLAGSALNAASSKMRCRRKVLAENKGSACFISFTGMAWNLEPLAGLQVDFGCDTVCCPLANVIVFVYCGFDIVVVFLNSLSGWISWSTHDGTDRGTDSIGFLVNQLCSTLAAMDASEHSAKQCTLILRKYRPEIFSPMSTSRSGLRIKHRACNQPSCWVTESAWEHGILTLVT